MVKLLRTENIYHPLYFSDLLLLLYLLTTREILSVIHLFLNLLNESNNLKAQNFQIQNHFLLSLFLSLFDNYFKKIQKVHQ